RRRHTRFSRDWSSDVCSSDLLKLHRSCLGELQHFGVFAFVDNLAVCNGLAVIHCYVIQQLPQPARITVSGLSVSRGPRSEYHQTRNDTRHPANKLHNSHDAPANIEQVLFRCTIRLRTNERLNDASRIKRYHGVIPDRPSPSRGQTVWLTIMKAPAWRYFATLKTLRSVSVTHNMKS